MKKLAAFGLMVICALCFCACGNGKQVPVTVFSFSGESEAFAISNGVIVLSEAEEVFYGGDLKASQPEWFSDIVSYTTTFYTLANGERRIILSNSVVDLTGGSVNVGGNLGSISGDSFLTGSKVQNADELLNNLWFELKTTDVNGGEHTYQLQLSLTEITASPAE